MKKLFTKFSGAILVVLAALVAVADLLHFGIPPTHDGEYHVMRFWQFYKVLSEGNLYPRWAPDFNNGYGIPLFNYVYPLPNYFAAIFHFLGFGFIEVLKLNFAAATIAGATFFYLWTRKYWGNLGGIVSSIFYTFSPYHFLDIYVRGSVGEVWSLGLFPALLWSYLNYSEKKKRKYFVFSSISLALLILAHNILAVVFFSLFLIYALKIILEKRERKIELLGFGFIILSGLGLSSPFWFPAILETKYVAGLQIFDPTQNFPKLYQLIYSSWGYGFSGTNPAGAEGQMSFQIGIANLTAVAFSILIFLKTKNKTILFFLILFVFFVFLITPFSSFLWSNIPFVSYIQFPWRLLSAVIVIASFLAGSLVYEELYTGHKKMKIIVACVLIIFTVLLGIKYAKAPFYHKRSDLHYLTRSNFTDGTNSPGDLFNTIWLKEVPERQKMMITADRGIIDIKVVQKKSTDLEFIVNSKEKAKLKTNIAYFPGWKGYINDKKANLVNDNGVISLNVPKGSTYVEIRLMPTTIQYISYLIFAIAIVLIIFLTNTKLAIIKK